MSHSSRGHLATVGRVFVLLALVSSLIAGSAISVSAATITFAGTECITRQESTSVSITIVPNAAIALRYQYGTTSGSYPNQTADTTAAAATPKTVVISGLTANTKYYYRLQYSTDSWATTTNRTQKSFYTARAAGSTFTFDITSDNHVNIVMGEATTWQNTLNDIAAESPAPDFLLDLGDTVAMRGLSAGDTAGATAAYSYTLPFFDTVAGSMGVYLVPGNHEQKERWHVDGTPNDTGDPINSLPIIGTEVQKKYYPMPIPDGFYTGDTITEPLLTGDHLKESYYAWTWGDALFVVIDPFWYTTTKPYVTDVGGGETNGTGSGDSWSWTLGLTQFNWLKTTLSGSTAKYKFIFTHQILSDASLSNQEDYGHAGANQAHMVEWGGDNEDTTVRGWSTQRAGWGTQTISETLAANHVTAVFHGHDHQYAYEKIGNVVYQSLPVGGWGNPNGTGFGMYTAGAGFTINTQTNAGHLRVTVAPAQTTVEYIKTGTTTSAYTYTMPPYTSGTGTLGRVNGDAQVNSTDALIILSADVGINTSAFCPMNCGDVNGDGFVNSTDALIILSYDVGISVPFPVGTGACPSSITQPPGCS
jgi:hypothetical protein